MAVDSDLRPGDPPADPASRLWWAVPAIGTLLLALFGMIFGGEPEKVDYGTSYDASGGGSRAAFLLFEELGYPVERSRRPTGGEVRWLLFPSQTTPKDAATLDDWVRRGGVALLALDEEAFAEQLGMTVSVEGRRRIKVPGLTGFAPSPPLRGDSYPAEAPDVSHVVAGPLLVTGPSGGRAWGRIGSGPIATIYPRGRGQIWLLNRPDVLANDNLRVEDNAVLACRLADAMLAERPGGRLAFDEYCHGLRDRQSVAELLFRPPVLGVTVQASPARTCSIRATRVFTSVRGRSSRNWSSATRSTARRRRPKPPYSKPCRSGRSRSMASRTSCPRCSRSSPRRTRWNRKEPTRCPRRNSTAS